MQARENILRRRDQGESFLFREGTRSGKRVDFPSDHPDPLGRGKRTSRDGSLDYVPR